MKQKKVSARTAVVALIVLVLVGIAAIAAEYGTQADPLVSQGYIDSVFGPQLLSQVDDMFSKKFSAVSNEINTAQDLIDQKISEFESRQLSVAVDQAFLENVSGQVIQSVQDQSYYQTTFTPVTVPKGKRIVLGIGTEAVVQSGNGKCVSSLVDTTTGGTASANTAVSKYHLYLSDAQGSGISATSELTLLVRGSYQIK